MRAAWYERQGPAREVLEVAELPDPVPGDGEVRIRLLASGINPGDVKKRRDAFGYGMPYPKVIPHSDGAGVIDQVGPGVPTSRVGERVWCYGAQSYRAFGTAAEHVVVQSRLAIPLPGSVFRAGGLPGHSRNHGLAGSAHRWTGARTDGAGARRRGGKLRHCLGQPCRSPRARHCALGVRRRRGTAGWRS